MSHEGAEGVRHFQPISPFRPISEAAHSWSYDNQISYDEPQLKILNSGGLSYLNVALTTVHELYNVYYSYYDDRLDNLTLKEHRQAESGESIES